jgi:hypothetical protein
MHLAAVTREVLIPASQPTGKRRISKMLVTKKMLLALTLVGALIGAGIGSLITHSAASSSPATTASYETAPTTSPTGKTPDQLAAEKSSQFSTTQEQTAYRQGFDEGYSNCSSAANNSDTRTGASPASYRESTSTSTAPARRYSSSRRAYYDYGTAPRGRTFWQKHRDKLTLAMGTGGGAMLGGLIGGKRGAGIGALAGLGGSALYTYKIRKRSRRY